MHDIMTLPRCARASQRGGCDTSARLPHTTHREYQDLSHRQARVGTCWQVFESTGYVYDVKTRESIADSTGAHPATVHCKHAHRQYIRGFELTLNAQNAPVMARRLWVFRVHQCERQVSGEQRDAHIDGTT